MEERLSVQLENVAASALRKLHEMHRVREAHEAHEMRETSVEFMRWAVGFPAGADTVKRIFRDKRIERNADAPADFYIIERTLKNIRVGIDAINKSRRCSETLEHALSFSAPAAQAMNDVCLARPRVGMESTGEIR